MKTPRILRRHWKSLLAFLATAAAVETILIPNLKALGLGTFLHYPVRLLVTILLFACYILWLLISPFLGNKSANSDNIVGQNASLSPIPHLAILRYENKTGNAENSELCEALPINLISLLHLSSGIKVIASESTFKFNLSSKTIREIGHDLQATYVLTGTIHRKDDRMIIVSRLSDATNDTLQWSNEHECKICFSNISKIVEMSAKAIAKELKIHLPKRAPDSMPPNGNRDAAYAYTHGMTLHHQFSQSGLTDAIKYYKKAVEHDPKFANAYAEMALAWARLGSAFLIGNSQEEAYFNADVAATDALRIDSECATGYRARGLMSMNRFDWNDAEECFSRAVDLSKRGSKELRAKAQIYAVLGRLHEAVELQNEAIEMSPLDATGREFLGEYLSALGQLDEGRRSIKEAICLANPNQGAHEYGSSRVAPYRLYAKLSIIEALLGKGDDALQAALNEEDSSYWKCWALAIVYAERRERKLSDGQLSLLLNKYSSIASYQIAEVYAMRNQTEEAFCWLERARSQRDSGIRYLLRDPLLKNCKSDDRFDDICRKVGLPVSVDSGGN